MVGGSLYYRLPACGLTVTATGRGLLVHESRAFKEWSAAGALRFDPGTPGHGVALRVAPSWDLATTGAEDLWALPDASALSAPTAARATPAARLAAELSCGRQTPGADGLLTPYVDLELAHGAGATIRLGGRLSADPRVR